MSSSTTSSFTLQSSVTDGSLFDGADDGYAHLNRTATSSATQTVVGAFGTVGALTYTITNVDVGQTLGFQVVSFDSINNGTGEGNRDLFIDSIAYSVSVLEHF